MGIILLTKLCKMLQNCLLFDFHNHVLDPYFVQETNSRSMGYFHFCNGCVMGLFRLKYIMGFLNDLYKSKLHWTMGKIMVCKHYRHSKYIRPVSSYATLGGGAPIRTALRHAIHLAYTARRFKCTN